MNTVLQNKKLFVFDMDGTIYLGSNRFDHAVDFIKRLRKNGKKVLFFTNNASKNLNDYMEKLKKMGFEPEREELLSSADSTVAYLKKNRPGKSVFILGTPALKEYFIQNGFEVRDDDTADMLVSSFDTTLTYGRLTVACDIVRSGKDFFSTHPDFNCPTETGFIPDSGAICAAITASTGREPIYFGKPAKQTAELIVEYSGVDREDICMFGDRLYTDIALGRKNGITSVLVLTGEATLDDVNAADPSDRPDFIYDSLREVDHDIF